MSNRDLPDQNDTDDVRPNQQRPDPNHTGPDSPVQDRPDPDRVNQDGAYQDGPDQDPTDKDLAVPDYPGQTPPHRRLPAPPLPDQPETGWFTTLSGLYARMWHCLTDGVAKRTAPARHPTFGTVGPDGLPSVRMVVLRRADPAAGQVDVHTDLHSAKVTHLRQTPCAALHVWDDGLRLQIRLSTRVTILTGADVADIWARVPDPSRQSYGTLPSPGTPIQTSCDYVKSPDAATFAVLRCRIISADLVHLGDPHRRARFDQGNGWAGQWLSP